MARADSMTGGPAVPAHLLEGLDDVVPDADAPPSDDPASS